jgi:hypothetical protein
MAYERTSLDKLTECWLEVPVNSVLIFWGSFDALFVLLNTMKAQSKVQDP